MAMAPEQQQQQELVTAEAYMEGRGAGEGNGQGGTCGGGTEKPLDAAGSQSPCRSCVESEVNGEVKLSSSVSFGSVTQETPTRVRASTWTIPFMEVSGWVALEVGLSCTLIRGIGVMYSRQGSTLLIWLALIKSRPGRVFVQGMLASE